MCENILSKENISFKKLEQICFKTACEFAKEMLKTMLEEYDKQLMDKTKAYEDDMLEEGKKEIEVLYQEADGVMICTQGKDRKEQYEKK